MRVRAGACFRTLLQIVPQLEVDNQNTKESAMADIQPRRDAIAAARGVFERAVGAGRIPPGIPFNARIEPSGDPSFPEQVVVIWPDGARLGLIAPVKFRSTICDVPLRMIN